MFFNILFVVLIFVVNYEIFTCIEDLKRIDRSNGIIQLVKEMVLNG